MIGWRDEFGVPREDCARCAGEHVTEASARACEARHDGAAAPVAAPGVCPHCGEAHQRLFEFAPFGCDPQALFRRTHRCALPPACRAGCAAGWHESIDDPGDRPARVTAIPCTRCHGSGFEPQEIPA